MSAKFTGVKELAEKWNVSTRRINQLCADGFIEGAYKNGKFWMVPADVQKPSFVREKNARYQAEPNRNTSLLPCPVGITSYKEVSRECYYVDKTMLIKDIIDEHCKVYLFTRPRRFGKTLAMNMLKTYFEISDEDTSVYFSDRKIWSAGPEYREYLAKYPVIYLSFKDAHQNNWGDMYRSLFFTIREEYLNHDELLSSTELNEFERQYYRQIADSEPLATEAGFALGKLSKMLAKHYKKKVIIIIDEYDTPIQQGYLKGCYEEVTGFMRNLFSAALKDNEDLEFGVLTGILRIAKESLFSGLNNLAVNTVMDEKYSDYFGFTSEEVAEMAAYYGKKEKLHEIAQWYDGYLFGNTEIYNPWSVISYFNNNCVPKAFWSRTSSSDMIAQLIRNTDSATYENLCALLQGKEVQAVVDMDIIYPEVYEDPDTVYSFLLVAGYLRIVRAVRMFLDSPICSLAIPNREIRSVFRKEILNQYSEVFTGSMLRRLSAAMHSENGSQLSAVLQDFLVHSASVYDTANESFYHGIVLGMLAVMSDSYHISSNRESGEGRFDVQLHPMRKTKSGYILEFKTGKGLNDAQLDSLAQQAVTQIREKQYYADLEYHGINDIILLGIAFCGKRVSVKTAKK